MLEVYKGQNKKMKKHIAAIFAIVATTLFISSGVYADSDATSYKISGYNKSGIITDENGTVLDDYGFCLDHTETTPSYENVTLRVMSTQFLLTRLSNAY